MEDANIIFEQYSKDPDVTRYLTWRLHENVERTKNFLNRCLSAWEDGTAFPYVITFKEGGHLMDTIEIRIDIFHPESPAPVSARQDLSL
jgi:ribosomal-protein-alanine N-acetyltransferase